MTQKTNRTIKWGEKGRGIDELIGFDEKKINELLDRTDVGDIKKTIKREFGKVSRYKREIIRQSKKVQYHTELLEKYLDLMEKEESRYLNMMKLLNPKVTIKRPTKSYPYWRGKVWWGVGRFKKRGWSPLFHIIGEKKRKILNLSEDEVREMGKEKFVESLIKKDLLLNDSNRK